MRVCGTQNRARRRVKSAERVLEVLEFFDAHRSDASVMNVARALNYPQSSTTELLKSLMEMGYLEYLPEARRYIPTHRVALLGSWIPSPYLSEGRVTRMMEELSDETQETIILAEQSSVVVRYIYVVPSKEETARLPIGPGTTRPLARSGIGRVFMSSLMPDRASLLLRRINASLNPGEDIVSYASLKPELERIRAQGYDVLTKGVTPGTGIVSMLLPQLEGTKPLALGIGGKAERISNSASDFVNCMRQAIGRNFPNAPSALRWPAGAVQSCALERAGS